MIKKILLLAIAISLVTAFVPAAMAQDDATCNWKVTALQVGKWGNGKKKDGLWPKGSFPIPAGTSERPDWYVNGVNCGKCQLVAGGGSTIRFLPNSSQYLKDGQPNTIMLKYSKPPCAGVSSSKTVVVDWSKVGPGQFYTFR